MRGFIVIAALLFVSAAASAEEANTSIRSVPVTSVGILLPASRLGDPLQVTCYGDAWPIKSSIKLSINWGWFSSRDYRQEAATSCTTTYTVFIEWDDNRTAEIGEYLVRIADAGWVFGSSQIIEKKITIDAEALTELRDRGQKDFPLQRGYHLRLMSKGTQK
jgi:hypothetical protein